MLPDLRIRLWMPSCHLLARRICSLISCDRGYAFCYFTTADIERGAVLLTSESEPMQRLPHRSNMLHMVRRLLFLRSAGCLHL